jgi:hypothetical protein
MNNAKHIPSPVAVEYMLSQFGRETIPGRGVMGESYAVNRLMGSEMTPLGNGRVNVVIYGSDGYPVSPYFLANVTGLPETRRGVSVDIADSDAAGDTPGEYVYRLIVDAFAVALTYMPAKKREQFGMGKGSSAVFNHAHVGGLDRYGRFTYNASRAQVKDTMRAIRSELVNA